MSDAPLTRRRRFFAALRSAPVLTKMCLFWLVVIVSAAVFADYIPGLADPNYQGWLFGLDDKNEGMSARHWLGTDINSRDMLARIIYGARVSLAVAVTSVVFGVVVGGLLGSFVGFVRGKREAVVMASIDIILAFPGLVLLLTVVTLLGSRDLRVISLVVGFLSIPVYTSVARANALAISQREFVVAARAMGTKDRAILFREVIPNVLPTVLAYALVSAAVIIVLEGALAFLALSVQPPTASWGNMINQARADLRLTVMPAFWPALALVMTVFSLNNVGDWLRRRNAHRVSSL